ncbi:MAG: S8 family serine peptidase, partial [Candidatus Eisenbacteria bacterium]|nr:S8 family serine peptidase [Candidatus Eisenbacteria bacterium]
VIAAFPDDVSDRLNTITFGLGQYDPEDLAMGSWGPCDIIGSPLEVATANWPDPGEGTAVSWAPDCLGGELVPVYWFLTYAYSNETIPLTEHPTHGGTFVDCSASPLSDEITDYGVMGFGVVGSNPCPGGLDGGEDGGEGDNPPTEAFTIFPEVIDTMVGCWSFVCNSNGDSHVENMALIIDGEEYSPTSIIHSETYTTLWNFDFPKHTSPKAAVLRINCSGSQDTERNLEIVYDSTGILPAAAIIQGRVSIHVRPGHLKYTPGAQYRTLPELSGSDDDLMARLAQLGVYKIRKTLFWESDIPVPISTDNGDIMPDSSLFRSYVIDLDPALCEQAVAQVLSRLPAIIDASVTLSEEEFLVCDGEIGDPHYDDQWNLMSPEDSVTYGIRANRAWCLTRGSGQRIGIIDRAVHIDHPDLADNFDGGETGDPQSDHGTIVTSIAVASDNGIGMVGAAPDAKFYTINIELGGGIEAITSAFYRASLSLSAGDVAVNCVGTGIPLGEDPNDYPSIVDLKAAVTQLVQGAQIPLFTPSRHYYSGIYEDYAQSFPASWDRSSSDDLVLSVGGSDQDGDHIYPVDTADILAPLANLWACNSTDWTFWEYYYVESSSMAAPHVAAVAAMVQDMADFPMTPSEMYDHLCNTATNGIVDAFEAVDMETPINPIANFTCTPANQSVILEWDLLDVGDIDLWGFAIYDKPTCWGPYDYRMYINLDDPQYAYNDHYTVPIPAFYDREYTFRLKTDPSMQTCYGTCIPLNGQDATPVPSAPLNPSVVSDGNSAIISCGLWKGPGIDYDQIEYWVYRWPGDFIPDCEEGAGGGAGTYIGKCWYPEDGCGFPPARVCYTDESPPGMQCAYRIRTAWRDGSNHTGLVVNNGPISDDLIFDISGINEMVMSQQDSALRCWPNPIWGSGRVNFEITNSRDGMIEMFCPSGRLIRRMMVTNDLNQASFNIEHLPSGVYYLKMSDDSGPVDAQKLVIVH